MNLAPIPQPQATPSRMSSREVAELTGKQHAHQNQVPFEDTPVAGYTDETGFPWFSSKDIYRLLRLEAVPEREYMTIYDILALAGRAASYAPIVIAFAKNVARIDAAIFGQGLWALISAVEVERAWFKAGSRAQVAACWVYMMHNPDNGLTKIGLANNVKTRFGTIASNESDLVLLDKEQFETKTAAHGAETSLHRHFKAQRARGEWFKLSKEQLAEAAEMLHRST